MIRYYDRWRAVQRTLPKTDVGDDLYWKIYHGLLFIYSRGEVSLLLTTAQEQMVMHTERGLP